MNKLFLGCVALAAMGLIASCSDNNTDTGASSDLILNASIGVNTRAEKSVWAKNDALGVYVTEGTLDKPYLSNTTRYNNINFLHNGKYFTASDIYLDETAATIYGYYPYNSAVTSGTSVPVESSTQTDYLYGVSTTPASISQKNVDITMKHALSMLVFKLRKASTYTEGAGLVTKIVIENHDATNSFKIAGTLNIQTGTVTGTSTNGSLALVPTDGSLVLTETFQNMSAICLPVAATSTKAIRATFTIDGRTFRFVFPEATKWEAGFRNNYSLTMGNTGLEIGGEGTDSGIAIEPWGDTTDSDISLVPVL